MSVKSIKLETSGRRIALLGVTVILFTGAVFFAKWCLANTVASNAIYKEVAEVAIDLAPADPLPHFALALLNDRSFSMEDLPLALAEFEKAAALSPNEFRLWLAVGKARERSGDPDGAEKAMRRALELAPNYAEVQWTLGNVLLRAGKTDEAFVEIRKAASGDPKYVAPAVSAAWQIFEGDAGRIRQNVGDSPRTNAALSIFLAKQKRFDEAMQTWSALPSDEKKATFKQAGEDLFKEMIAAKKYRAALQIQNEIGDAGKGTVGKISNGGFEAEIAAGSENIFDWQIAEGAKPQIGPNNSEKHGGNLSLLLIFSSPDGKDFRAVSQVVAVEPGRRYELEVFYKSQLKAASTLRWEIADAADGKVIASTDAVSGGADWTSLKTEFTAPESSEGVIVRLARESCAAKSCAISGSIWFDDFELK